MTEKPQHEIAASVSDAEIEILQQLWEQSPLSAQQIIDGLQRDSDSEVHPKTVKTLINRLLKKGALSFTEQQRKYLYSPLIDRDAFYQQKTASFLDKYFDGGLTPLVSFFSRQQKLDQRDIAELKQLLSRLEEGGDE